MRDLRVCTVCSRVDLTVAFSLEFGQVLCDPCYNRACTSKRAVCERADGGIVTENQLTAVAMTSARDGLFTE